MTRIWILGLVTIGLGACTIGPPQGPSVVAMPPQGKDFGQFQREDAFCQQTAMNSLGLNSEQAPAQAAIGSAAIGTAVGAVAGGLIGAATGNAGAGAAIGAGTGLIAGSVVGAGAAQNTNLSMQGRYDVTYSQCMASYGNTVQPLQVSVPVPVYAPPVYPAPYPYGVYVGPRVGWGWGYGWGWGRPYGGYYRRW
ncbi:glycine zipper family protein [Sediminicoccus rosea]|jgi:hypothetical protein|uniref:Glycine zipper family protein n=1 Tax=Sediminicoccus rosea TaxID=1225128 RepID=A0ABZ0PI25_9PROT|nr:glycine zipper family protein [Sediminicoccus rosea]WPB85117.1 glycine zipper family protein [Sediminicoccus rosea]